LTDGLSSEIAYSASLNKGEIKEDLEKMVRIILDLNPLIRKYDREILVSLKKEVDSLYDKYQSDFDTFYLPLGNSDATSISALRKNTKIIIRLIFKNDPSNRVMLDIFHEITNLFHLM